MTRKRGLFALLVIAAVWTVGLFWFASLVNRAPRDITTRTEALIVLTGGTERVAAAIELLKQEKAEKLLISGVNKKVDWVLLAQTIDELPDQLTDKITLGHVACNTRQNALESKDWLERNRFTSVRLVTASYHMPRSMSEFKNVMPDMKIIPHPIFPQTVKHDEWWKWPGTFTLIMSEYMKFLFVSIKHVFPFIHDSFNAETVCEQ
ncbi:MAG: YdcF family protein [Alphaproteobacteria bacterium]|nr:YdcF family protein [Alphaproteobacteria bacterium]MBO4643345.1 YdcF family protein [Alphaproteobacteria bacterium]